MKILVTGGAGYIGSFMTKRLLDDNYQVTVLDSLERGHKESVDSRAELKVGNLLNDNFLAEVFSGEKFDGIIHFAGYISVAESMQQPAMYYEDNFCATQKLLEAARAHGVDKIIFSSTAAVYGNPVTVPIPENHQKNPESPYGESKLAVEGLLRWYQQIHGISSISLRYFNACGAELDGSMGEAHIPESHIIPNVIAAVLHDKPFSLYGADYQTPDGTCVRDYIHVKDLVEAHVLALKRLTETKGNFQYNVGTGKGYSNKEVVEMVKKVSGKEFPVTMEARRPGDPAELVADVTNITQALHFTPQYSDLETIVKSAWEWHNKTL